jgi:hypothetical protein
LEAGPFGNVNPLEELLQALEEELTNYLGMQNELRMKLVPEVIYEKPPELIYYEQQQLTGLPLWAGGLMDQPHLWMLFWKKTHDIVSLFEVLREQQDASQKSR